MLFSQHSCSVCFGKLLARSESQKTCEREKRKEEPRDNRKVNNTFYLKSMWELDTSGVRGGVD